MAAGIWTKYVRRFTSCEQYMPFITRRSASREPSAIRSLQPLVNLPGMISLGGGMPNSATFPFQSIQLECTDGRTIHLEKESLEGGLQYSPTPGIPSLNDFLFDLQIQEHQPPDCNGIERSLAVTQGSQDALSKAFDMLLDEGDSLLIETPTYPGSLAYLRPIGCRFVELETDGFGLIPDQLAHIMDTWDDKVMGKRPRVLYTIPTGGNPTGASLTLERKKKIYEIASKHNIIILEDDPYYYLRLDEDRSAHKSFLNLDTEARVLRFDSLSKILSSGMRIGFVTGPTCLIERINLHSQASNMHPSGISQILAVTLLKEWGRDGWEQHLQSVCAFYQSQRQAFLECAEKHLTGLAEWNTPGAGMFVWIKLLGVRDSHQLIQEKAIANKVLLVPGSVFLPNSRESSYVRASYSTASKENMDIALSRLKDLLLNHVDN